MDQKKLDTLKDFLKFCKKELNIQSLPSIKFIKDRSFVEDNRSYGEYNPNENSLKVFILNRNLADICRSLAHELTHHRQKELNMIGDASGNTGSDIENEANAMAGILMRDYGKLNLGVYDLDSSNNSTALNERKQAGILYHFTTYSKMRSIIEDHFVLKSFSWLPYVSFTRNKNMSSDTISDNVRISIDGTLLSDRYILEPHADAQAGYGRGSVDESEERISLTRYPKGVDISKCIVEVAIKKPRIIGAAKNQKFDDEESFEPPFLSTFSNLVEDLKQKNIPYTIVEKFK